MKGSDRSLLSTKPIPRRERLILALDVPTGEDAKRLVNELGDSVLFYKLGLQLFMSGDYFPLIKWLTERNKKVFVDLKFFDVPETVKSAVAQLRQHHVSFATVHGNEGMLRAAIEEKDGIKILSVTVLTSLDQTDLQDLGFECDVATLVLSRARRALEVGCDGVISSGLEAETLRNELGDNFLIVAPGIRPVENRLQDDQKRIVTVQEAFLKGADYVVIGRPIRSASNARCKAEEIQAEIAELFG
ncbi:MAG: orotidine-5'-phosphate decarboxylase [Verrucomicrobia bacterium]|nr:orotidine-5'-phosphate decarboxylase [Verrucomicrobiota bacterium]